MEDNYGSDFITISDEDGTEYELEVLSQFEHKGSRYMAVIPAGTEEDEGGALDVSLLKIVEEDGEDILCAIEDEQELEEVYNVMMDLLYEDEEE